MSRNSTLTLFVLGAAMIGGAVASGCGRLGPLDQPPPLFGERAKAAYYAQNGNQQGESGRVGAASEEGSAERTVANEVDNTTDDDDNAPLTRRDVKDPDTQLTTPRDSPVPGAPNSMGPNVSVSPPNR